jgi:hypothetical protein
MTSAESLLSATERVLNRQLDDESASSLLGLAGLGVSRHQGVAHGVVETSVGETLVSQARWAPDRGAEFGRSSLSSGPASLVVAATSTIIFRVASLAKRLRHLEAVRAWGVGLVAPRMARPPPTKPPQRLRERLRERMAVHHPVASTVIPPDLPPPPVAPATIRSTEEGAAFGEDRRMATVVRDVVGDAALLDVIERQAEDVGRLSALIASHAADQSDVVRAIQQDAADSLTHTAEANKELILALQHGPTFGRFVLGMFVVLSVLLLVLHWLTP